MDDSTSQQTQPSANALNKPLGMFRDPQGDFSSGRFIKVFSFFVAVLLAGFLCIVLWKTSKTIPADPNLVNAVSWVIGAFLGVATGSELVQKITGR